MTETAASKRVKQQSQTTLTNNKMLIPSKSPEDEVLTCQKPNASIFSKLCAFPLVCSKINVVLLTYFLNAIFCKQY